MSSRFFGHSFAIEHVIEETLSAFTAGGPPSQAEVIAALSLPIARDLDAFRRHPLVRWLEYKLGVEFERGGGLRRRMPRSLPEVVPRLAEFATAEQSHCEERLREVLTLGGELVREDGNRALAFKLHQFISQGRALYATLEATGAREFSLEGQLQAGSGRLFAPTKFCRQCGQDYYNVLRGEDRFLPHPVGIDSVDGEGVAGYLMLAPADNDWNEGLIPEEWRNSNGRLKTTCRDRVPAPVWVSPGRHVHLNGSRRCGKDVVAACALLFVPELRGILYAREREFGKLPHCRAKPDPARPRSSQHHSCGTRARRELPATSS